MRNLPLILNKLSPRLRKAVKQDLPMRYINFNHKDTFTPLAFHGKVAFGHA